MEKIAELRVPLDKQGHIGTPRDNPPSQAPRLLQCATSQIRRDSSAPECLGDMRVIEVHCANQWRVCQHRHITGTMAEFESTPLRQMNDFGAVGFST
jgi:hypothetical protein